jgi:hypothetical protein
MTRNRIVLGTSLAAVLWCALATGANDDLGKPRLKIYDNRSSPQGLWKMEIIEATDPKLMANAKTLSQTAICMDAALEMGKGVKPTKSDCTQAVLKDMTSEAQIEKHCPDTGTTTMTLRKESKDTIWFETIEKGKAGVISTMRGRYHYVGPCKAGDNLVQVDKDSEACQRMRAEVAARSPETECASLEGAQKADCVKHIETALEKARQLCE